MSYHEVSQNSDYYKIYKYNYPYQFQKLYYQVQIEMRQNLKHNSYLNKKNKNYQKLVKNATLAEQFMY